MTQMTDTQWESRKETERWKVNEESSNKRVQTLPCHACLECKMQKTRKKKQYNDALIVFQFSLLEFQLRRNSCSDDKETKGIDRKEAREQAMDRGEEDREEIAPDEEWKPENCFLQVMESNAPALSWAGSCAGRDNTVYTPTTNNYSPRVSKVGPPGHDLNCAGGGAVTVAGENGNAKKETLAWWFSGYIIQRRKRKRRGEETNRGGEWPGLDSDRRILPTVSSVFCSCDRFKTNLFFWLAFHRRGLFSPIFSFSGRYVPKTFNRNFIFGITYIIF